MKEKKLSIKGNAIATAAEYTAGIACGVVACTTAKPALVVVAGIGFSAFLTDATRRLFVTVFRAGVNKGLKQAKEASTEEILLENTESKEDLQ